MPQVHPYRTVSSRHSHSLHLRLVI